MTLRLVGDGYVDDERLAVDPDLDVVEVYVRRRGDSAGWVGLVEVTSDEDVLRVRAAIFSAVSALGDVDASVGRHRR